MYFLMEWKHVKFKEEGNLGQLNFFGQILKKGKNLSTRSGNVEGMIRKLRFRGPFNSTNRATTRFSFGRNWWIQEQTFNYCKENKHGDRGKNRQGGNVCPSTNYFSPWRLNFREGQGKQKME